MSGRNQHHIPVFLQKGFAICKSGAKKIWVWERDNNDPPEEGIIKKTGAEDCFYSDPDDGNPNSLDNRITDLETLLARRFIEIRNQPTGASIDSDIASEIILHFSTRTAHLRGTMEAGLTQFVEGASTLLDNPDNLAHMAGLTENEPNDKFRELIWPKLKNHIDPDKAIIPIELIERILFFFAQENFEDALETTLPSFQDMFRTWTTATTGVVREGHNRALEGILDKRENPRREYLAQLDWSIEKAPDEGAILPDCVVLSISDDGTSTPYMHIDREAIEWIIMPVSSEKLLVGRWSGTSIPNLKNINSASAHASYDFFLSASDGPKILQLHDQLGLRSMALIEEAVEKTFLDYLPPSQEIEGGCEVNKETENLERTAATHFNYQVTLADFGDEDLANRITVAVGQIIDPLSKGLPLRRLDGITFAVDFPTAVRGTDTGMPDHPPPEAMDVEDAQNLSETVTVVRDGEAKARIVLGASVLTCLLEGSTQEVEWAVRVIVHQLVLVAMYEWIEMAIPGATKRPLDTQLDYFLHEIARPATFGFVASNISSGFGDPAETAETHRTLLIESLNRLRTTVPEERLAYLTHRDLDKLVLFTMPIVQQSLMFAANLLGHCEATGQDVEDDDGELSAELEASGLQNWLPLFHKELASFRQKLARWESINEFLSFNRHAERLMWQVGMVPWENEEGLRIEIPLNENEEAILAKTSGDG